MIPPILTPVPHSGPTSLRERKDPCCPLTLPSPSPPLSHPSSSPRPGDHQPRVKLLILMLTVRLPPVSAQATRTSSYPYSYSYSPGRRIHTSPTCRLCRLCRLSRHPQARLRLLLPSPSFSFRPHSPRRTHLLLPASSPPSLPPASYDDGDANAAGENGHDHGHGHGHGHDGASLLDPVASATITTTTATAAPFSSSERRRSFATRAAAFVKAQVRVSTIVSARIYIYMHHASCIDRPRFPFSLRLTHTLARLIYLISSTRVFVFSIFPWAY